MKARVVVQSEGVGDVGRPAHTSKLRSVVQGLNKAGADLWSATSPCQYQLRSTLQLNEL